MPVSSKSLAALIQRNNLAVAGTNAHLKEMPPAAAAVATSLAKRQPTIEALNATQEAARAALKGATAALNKEVKAGNAERQKLIAWAVGTFGPNGPEIVQFRSKVDAKV